MIDKDFFTYTKVAGVTHRNDKNIEIQNILPLLKENGRIYCIRDYSNRCDSNAIKIFYFTKDENIHIGYINKELAAEIAPFLDENPVFDLDGAVEEVTGNKETSYGCNIRIWIQGPNEPNYEDLEVFRESLSNPKNNNQTQNAIATKAKKQHGIALYIFLSIILLFVFAANSFLGYIFKDDFSDTSSSILKETAVEESLITLNEFQQLKTGMSRNEVYKIVGSYGELVSESSADGYSVKMYSYEGYGSTGANAQLMFTNGELDTKAQFGLQSNYGKENGTIDEDSTSLFLTPENEVPVKINDLVFSLKILPPNIIDTVYIEGTYTNSSKYTITGMTLTVLLKDKNDKTYLSCYDTVLPGETSPKFDSFGPQSQSSNDIEYLECRITILDENNEKVFITYDYKLKSYEVV